MPQEAVAGEVGAQRGGDRQHRPEPERDGEPGHRPVDDQEEPEDSEDDDNAAQEDELLRPVLG